MGKDKGSVKIVLEGNSFYEIDLKCWREKERQKKAAEKQNEDPEAQRKRRRG